MRDGVRDLWAVAAVAAALAGLAGCGGTSTTGAAAPVDAGGPGRAEFSCVGPTVTVSPSVVRPGHQVRVSGSWFHTGCGDERVNGAPVESPRPWTGLTVRLEQDGSTWVLARQVAARTADGVLDLPVTLPRDLRPGSATLRVVGPEPATDGPSAALVVAGGGGS